MLESETKLLHFPVNVVLNLRSEMHYGIEKVAWIFAKNKYAAARHYHLPLEHQQTLHQAFIVCADCKSPHCPV